MWHSRPPRDPPPFMANAILNFHFDFLNPSLIFKKRAKTTYYIPQYKDHLLYYWRPNITNNIQVNVYHLKFK